MTLTRIRLLRDVSGVGLQGQITKVAPRVADNLIRTRKAVAHVPAERLDATVKVTIEPKKPERPKKKASILQRRQDGSMFAHDVPAIDTFPKEPK